MRASGKDEAGIAVIAMAEALGVAAATASHASCRIGDAADMIARGVVSHANALARALGVAPGMACRDAAAASLAARASNRDPEPCGETRRVLEQAGLAPAHRADRLGLADRPERQGPDHRHRLARRPRRRQRGDGPAGRWLRRRLQRCRRGRRTMPASPGCRRSMAAASPASPSRPPPRASATPPPSTRTASISHVNATAQRLGASPGERLKARLIALA